jgi:hypothetical protein
MLNYYKMDLRKSLVLLKDLFALCYYDNFIKLYEIYPEDFEIENSQDPEYPEIWFRWFITYMLESVKNLNINEKNNYCIVIFKFFMEFNILHMPRYKENFKYIIINKAKELLQNNLCSKENINTLKNFLEMYPE